MSLISDARREQARAISVKMLAERRGQKLNRKGQEWAGACPFCCDGEDRFYITKDNHWACRHCAPEGGDAIDFVMKIERCTYPKALEILVGPSLQRAPSRSNGGNGQDKAAPKPCLEATCCPGGAPYWPKEPEFNEHFRGGRFVILPDNDEPGRKRRDNAGEALRDIAASIFVLELPGLGPKEDVKDWAKREGNDQEALNRLLEHEVRPWQTPTDDNNVVSFPSGQLIASEAPDVAFAQGGVGLKLINPADRQGASIPERRWCVPDYIPHATVTLLSGDGGEGKSLLALQLGVARALGQFWVGLPTEPGRTLHLSAEDDDKEILRRLDAILRSCGAQFSDIGDMRVVDLVGEDCILGELSKGRITPTEAYHRLDASMSAFRPSLTTLDVLTDMFGGEENARVQVRQFVNLLKRLARKHDCAILLLAHPSLTGMNTGSGLSGSTDWHNAVRSRIYFQTPKKNGEEPQNKNLRTLQGLKSNYGERGGKIDVEWKNGAFIPLAAPTGYEKAAADQHAENVFSALLKRFNHDGRDVSPNKSSAYAPAVFADSPGARGLTSRELAGSMERLFGAGKIKVETKGPRSRQTKRLVLVDGCGDA
jgi:RecA-family ATPase